MPTSNYLLEQIANNTASGGSGGSGSSTVTVSNFPSNQTVNGAVTANIGTTNGLALNSAVNQLLKPSDTLNSINSVNLIGVIDTILHCNVSNFPTSQNVVVTSIPEVEIKNDISNPIPISGTVNTNNVISSTVGFSSVKYVYSAATNNATLVKNSSTVIDSICLYTTVTNTTIAYLKLYNKATIPIVGTDVPFAVFKINVNQGAVVNFPKGLLLNQGFGFAITRGASPIDNTAIGLGEITGSIIYA